jgi:hypothetical protein
MCHERKTTFFLHLRTIFIMGADFYIRIYLKIEHNNGISYYELPTQRGYFFDFGNIE